MIEKNDFITLILKEFPEDRLTYQKSVPTFHPESGKEAAEFIKIANKNKQRLFITGFGNNIDPIGQPFDQMISIRTDRLNKLHEIAPEDFFVRVGSGYPLRELNQHLAEKQLYLPHASLAYVGSVGGAIAVNLTADHHQHDLPIKKYFIMAEIVTPEGNIIRPGSVCFKSVSGYDIVKIYTPSWGLLGMVVSVTLRVMPISGSIEYRDLKMKPIEQEQFFKAFDRNNDDINAHYSRKIKNKFDPYDVFPIVNT